MKINKLVFLGAIVASLIISCEKETESEVKKDMLRATRTSLDTIIYNPTANADYSLKTYIKQPATTDLNVYEWKVVKYFSTDENAYFHNVCDFQNCTNPYPKRGTCALMEYDSDQDTYVSKNEGEFALHLFPKANSDNEIPKGELNFAIKIYSIGKLVPNEEYSWLMDTIKNQTAVDTLYVEFLMEIE